MSANGSAHKANGKSAKAKRKAAHFSSRVTTGRALFDSSEVDARCKDARRFRDLITNFSDDQGNRDELTEAQRQIIRRSATLSLACEKAEADLVSGKPFDLDLYSKAANTLSRLLGQLGIYRTERPMIDLSTYLKTPDGDDDAAGSPHTGEASPRCDERGRSRQRQRGGRI